MTNNDYPRLCRGTFFILVLQALRQRMIKVINSDYRNLPVMEMLSCLITEQSPLISAKSKEEAEMEDKFQKMPSELPATPQQAQFRQNGNENVMVPNYRTVNITVQQMPTVLNPAIQPQMVSYQMPMMIRE